MCDPVTIGLILTAAGTGTQVANNQISMRRQDRELARGIRRQGEIQRNANSRVGEEIDEFATNDGSAERSNALEGFRQALRASDTASVGALDPVVGANPRFAEAVGQGQQQVRGDAQTRAGLLSRIDAPRYQRLNEGAGRQRAASDLGELGRRSSADDFITQLRVNERRPNEFINALAEIAKGAGSAMSLGAGGAGTVATGAPATTGAVGAAAAGPFAGGSPFLEALRRSQMTGI